MESFVGNTRPFFQGLPTSTRGYEGSTLRDQTQAPPTPTPPATPTLPPAHGYNPYTAGLTSSAPTTTLPGSLTPSRPITPATPSHKPHDHSVTSLLHPPTSKTAPTEARYMAKFEHYRHPMARPADPLHDARPLAHSYGSQSGLTVENPLPRPYSSQPPQSSVSKALPRPYSSQAPSLDIRPSRPYSTQPAVGADARIPSRPYSTSHSTSSSDLRAYQYPFSAQALVTDPRVHLDPRFLERSESRSLDSRSLEARPDPRGVPRPEQWGPGYRPDIKSLERQTPSVHIAAPVTVNGSKDALYLGKRSEDVASVRRQEESYARRSSELLQVNGSRDPLYPNGPQSTFPSEAQRTPSSERPKDSRPKEDSALDLSVKTVRQTPDSTAPDPEKNYSISPINAPVDKTVQNETPKRTPNSTPVSSPYRPSNRDSSLAQYVELQKHNPGISGTRATPPSHLTPHYGLSTPTSPLPSTSPIARGAHLLPPAKRSGDPLYADHFAKLPKLSHTPPNKSPTPRHLTEGHLALHPRDKAFYGVTREDPNRGLNLLATATLDAQDGRYGHIERRHSTDRKDPNSDWRDPSLERRDKGESSLALREAERRERSLERRDLSLERRDISVEHRDVSIERRDLGIERRNAISERRDPSLEKRELSLDKRELDSKYLYSKHPDVKLPFDQYRAWVPSSEHSKSDSSAIDRPKYLPGQHSVPTSVPTTLPQQGSSVSPAQPPHPYTSYGRPHDSRLPQTQFPQLGQPSAHHQASAAQSSYPKIHQPYLPTPTTRAQQVPVSSSSSHPSEPLHPPVSQTLHYPYSSSHSYSQAVAAQYQQQQQQHQKQQRLSSQYPPFSVPQSSKAGSTSALPSPHQAYAYAHHQQRSETSHAVYPSKRQSQISPHPSVSPHPSLSPHPTASPHPSASPHPAASPHSTVSPHTSHQGLSSSQYSPHPSQRPPAVSVSQHSAHSYPGTLPPSPYSSSQSHSAHTTPPSSRPSSATPQQPHAAPQSLPSHPPHSSRQSSHSTSAYSTPPHHAHPTQPQHASARENQGKQGHTSQASSVEPHTSQANSRQSQSHPPPPALHPSHSHHPSQPYPPHHSSQPYPHPPHPSQPYASYHTSSYPPPPQPYSLSSHPSQPYPAPPQYHSSQPHPPNHHPPHHHTPALHPSHPHAPPVHPSYHPSQVHPPPHHPSYPSQPSQTPAVDSHQSTAPSHARNTPAPSQPPRPPSSTKGPPPPVSSSQAPPTSSSQQTAPTPTPTPTATPTPTPTPAPTPTPTPPTQSLPSSARSTTPSQPPPATSNQSEPPSTQLPPPSSQPTPTAPSQPHPPSSTSQPQSSSSQPQVTSAQHPPKSPSHPLPPPAVSQAHGVQYSHQQPHPSPASTVQSHPPAHAASTQSNPPPPPPSTQASTSHHHHSSHTHPHLHSHSKSHIPPTQQHPPSGQPHLPPSQSHPSAHLPPTHLHHPPAHPLPPAQSHPSQPYPHYPSQAYYSHPHHSQTYAPQSHSSTHHSSQSHPSYPHHPTGHPPQAQQPHAPPLRSHPSQGGHLPPPHSSPMHLPQVRHPHPHGPGMYPPHPPQQSSHPGPPHPSQPHVQGYPPHPQQPHYQPPQVPHSSVKAESGSHYPAHYPYPHQAGQSHDSGSARGPAVTSPPQSVKGKACQDLDPSRIRTKGEQKSFDSRNAESGKVNTDSWTTYPAGTQSAPQSQQANDQVTYNSTRPLHQPHLSSNQEVPKVFDFREEGAQKTDNVQGNKSLEPGKAALADKLHKKLGRAESTESLVVKKETEPIKKKEEVPEQKDDWGSGFDKLLEDLAANPEGVTSRKSKTLGARYLQKVQIQHAIDNDLIVPPPAAIVEEEDESEPEPPVKFRGKFKSIKDKKVERVILTYASHSDESATEMIPDEDASDFEEELKREIRSKDKKRAHMKKPRRDSSSGSEGDIKDSDRRKGRRGKNKENKPNNKQDSDYSVSSSSSSVSDSSSSLSSDDSDSDDSESEEPVRPRRKGKLYSDSDTSRKKPKRCGRKWDSDSSDSEEEIIPRRRTRRRRKSSSDEDSYKPSQRNKKRKKKQDSSESDEVPLKAKRGKKSKKSDSDDEDVSSTRRGRKKGRIANGKKKNRQRDDSDDESDEKALPRKTRGMKKKQQEAKGRSRRRSSSSESSSSESEEEDNMKRKKQVEQKRKGNKKCGKILEDSSEDSELPTKYKNHAKSSLIVDSDDSDDDSKKENKEMEDEKLKGQEDVEDKKDESSEKTDIENEAKDETQPEEDTLDFSEDFETNVESDSVIEKLNKLRNEELNREDVLEMKAWFGEVNSELKNQLKNVQDISYRNCWKKPQFGAGDDFQHGWQTDVKKYKELTARLPKKLCVSVKHQEMNSSRASSRNGRDREMGKDSPSRHGSSSPAKNTRSKSGIIKTSMAVAEDDKLKVASRPEISSVMQRFFEKVLAESGNDVISKGLGSKKFNLGPFPPYGAQRVPTGLTPTPSVAPSMLASDDSDLDSLASIRTDLPASDSVPVSKRSIASSLLKKIGRKYNDKKLNTLCLNKPRNILEATNKPQLLPTPGMPTTEKDLEDMSPDQMKLATFFRKETVSNYRDNFEVVVTKNGINEFTPILYQSRTRTKTKQIQDAATVKSVFGADIPPHLLKKVEAKKAKKTLTKKGEKKDDNKSKDDSSTVPVSRASTPGGSLRVHGDDDDDSELRSERSESVLGESSTPSVIKKSRRKLRKFRSGFDYIRKKKKVKPDDEATPSRKRLPVRKHVNWPEESRDVAAEVRSWVVNKGLGETVLHKAARLQYHDVVVYCAESPDFDINVRDNAGYTPLHEACNRGHLDIAQVLCAHGAHVNAPGYKGMRPLHEAVENGHAELARLLLAYGADPMLTTYAGQTCLDLCADVQCTQLIEGFLADLKGHDGEMWHFSGPVRFSDPEEQGCDIFSTIPVPVSKKSEETVTTDQDTDSKPILDSVISSRVKVDEGDNCQKSEQEENLVPVVDGKGKESMLDKEPSLSVGEIITVENTIKIKTEPNAVEENSDSEQLAEKTLSHSEEVRKIDDEKIAELKEESDSEEGWDLQAFVFEMSDSQIPDTYEVEGRPYKYLLLFDLLGHLKVTQQELIIAAKTVETLELSPEEFEKQAHCCIVGSCSRALIEDCSSVVLVKITPSLEKLLGIETVRL